MTVIKRLLSTASAITLCTSLLLTAPAYANYAANNESAPEASVVCEDTSQRTAFSKHFLLDDGSYVAVSYPEAVHIKTDDGWEEIDNSLSADKNGTITNKNPAFPVAFNNTVSNSVSMGANDNRISWSLKAETKTSSVNADISRGITGNVIKHTADEVAAAGSILYENIFSGTQNVSVRYTVMHNKVEEDILLAEPGNITAFSMDVYAPGMTAIVNNDNTVTICNSSEVLYRISAPYMCDAADAVLNDFNVTVAYTANGFQITYNPADGWLNDSARVYPVLFDPAITTSEYKSGMIDTYVMEGNTAAHNSEQKLYAGIKNGKLCRTYLKFTSLPAIPDNMPITGAKLFVLNTNGSTTGRRFGLYKVQSSWNPDTITYSNQPSIGRLLDTDDFDASDLTNCFSLSDDLNSFYTEYFAGSNFGYMLRYTDESTTNPDYNAFYSTENTTRANRPYIKIYYGYSMPTCLSANAVYSIKNAASGKYLSVFNGTDANGTNVCQLAQNNGTSQQFKLELTSEGACVLRAKCSSNGSGRVLDIAKSGGYVQNGCNVQLYNKVDAIAQEWLILAAGSGFRIVPRTNMSLALTSYGSANGTADGKSATSAGNVYVGNYTGSLNQVWYFYNKNGEQITPESFPGLQPDDYYFNNASTGAFIKRLNSDVIPMAGSLSMLGGSIKWRTESIGNGEYVIRLAADPTLYLKGSTSLPDGSGGPVSLQSITSGNVPSICRWRVEYDDGLIIINASTGYYLCCTSGTLGTVSSKYATNYKWRRVPASQYGTTSSFIMRELESVTMDSFEMNIGQSLSPTIHKRPANTTVLWAEAKDFVFSPSVSSHISINTATGEFTAKLPGTTQITAVHKITGKTATFSVTVRNLLIYQTKKGYYTDDYGNIPEDLQYNDMSKSEILEISSLMEDDLLLSPEELKQQWIDGAKFFAKGELEDVILDMIDHFMDGSGTPYSHASLTKSAFAHNNTVTYIEKTKKIFDQLIKDYINNLQSLGYSFDNREKSPMVDSMRKNKVEPVHFNTIGDTFDGLRICVNDVWGNTIEITSLTVNDDSYTCTLHYTLYDHFGLDKNDVQSYNYALFRAWYILQHYSEFNGRYKPFLTIMESDVTFEGKLS